MITVNKAGPDWANIKRWLEQRIAEAHIHMEQQLTVEVYHALRGSISLARLLIEEVEPTTPPKTEDDDYGISIV